MTTTARPELEGLDRYKFGWADSGVAGAAARRGLSEDVVRDISAKKNEPEWMLDLRLKGLRLFRRKPMPTWGSDLSGIDFENIKYFVRSTEKQAASWDDLPADIKSTYDKLGIPAVVHLRAEGRARGDPAAGLLPDQHREHGPVRADPDHRRRGRLRALCRGLHGADLLLGLAALRGRRDHREEGRPLPVHHDPELVEQRLQPGHQARGGARRRDHGVDRRQHRLQGDDEVPGGLADRRAGQGAGVRRTAAWFRSPRV